MKYSLPKINKQTTRIFAFAFFDRVLDGKQSGVPSVNLLAINVY